MQIFLFVMATIIGTKVIGADSIIITDDVAVNKIPSDIVKMFTVIHDMVNDLAGGCEECIKSEKPIPLPKIDVPTFKQLVNILIAVKITLDAGDLSKVKESELELVIKNTIRLRSSQTLLDLLTLANFHGLKPFVNAASTLWAEKYFNKKSGFNALNNDIKSIIIKKLSPSYFMALVEANDNFDDSSKEEMFKIALKFIMTKNQRRV